MQEMLHIIEPTLEGEAGHCYSFVTSLCQAAGTYPLTVWYGNRAVISLPPGVCTRRFFFRTFRRLQAFWLYHTLLRQPGRLFISTAGRTDLILLNLACRGEIPPHKVFLYIHWFRPSPGKRRQLEKLAERQPGITVLTPTASVFEEFRAAGFAHTRLVPYPITPLAPGEVPAEHQAFRRLLFAGAARRDKGFSAVVDFVALLAQTRQHIPVSLQTSSAHYAKFDDTTMQDLARLEAIAYPNLERYAETLHQAEYRRLFSGAICLQLYSRQDFADRISGVTLDALSAGSPVVTLSGTWMGRVVAEFDAGAVIESSAPEVVLTAVQRVMERYEYYRDNAIVAGRELQKRNSAEYLFRELTV
ncbi:glycosyltransferase [Geobacter sp. SVR]|uniref:glycosyltransferase n=1 Tax=Geobacter sp. SVR TaxID=2495594 RepID=UPI00143F03AA|nr:glycosyltransferase [Geobacter sp. SVR]BCS52419.1 hypothetical protein GSVR_07270 [Geobacter sp. SVR]GCF87350.1 hypothetical protein GSbR_39500 [Geobacter sp. SVR]